MTHSFHPSRALRAFSAFVVTLGLMCVGPMLTASAQLEVVTEVAPDGTVSCEMAPDCPMMRCDGDTFFCLDVNGNTGCVDDGQVLCCATDEDCPQREDAETTCVKPGASATGVCIERPLGVDPACYRDLSDPAVMSECFGSEQFLDGDCDGDLVANTEDNCLCEANPDQVDCDGNDIGRVCEGPRGATDPGTACGGGSDWEDVSCDGTGKCVCYTATGPEDARCTIAECRMATGVDTTLCGTPDGGVAPVDAGMRSDAGAGMADAGVAPPASDDEGGCATGGRTLPPMLLMLGLALIAIVWRSRIRPR